MRVLLIGEFSGLHWTLAQGLRALGHEVCVISDGSGWKNFPRDVSIKRESYSYIDGLLCYGKMLRHLPSFRKYDVVQIVHPNFLNIRAQRTLPIYRYLRKHNDKIFMGAFGPDYYYAKTCMETNTFRYSDYRVGDRLLDHAFNRINLPENLYGGTARANREIAETCDGIIACLYEYYVSYKPYFPNKTAFIPLPIDLLQITPRVRTVPDKVNFFIGIQKDRSEVKGTDIMYPVLQEVCAKYPDDCRITKVVSVPIEEYNQLLDEADVQLDQLYSYTPSINSLLAMSKGIVVVGGGEEENYRLLNEEKLRPIINVLPDKADVYNKLENLILHKERIPELSDQSIEYVKKYHDHIRVAQQYLDFWNATRND